MFERLTDEEQAVEDQEIIQSVRDEVAGMSRVELKGFLADIQSNPKHSYNDPHHPKHAIAVKGVQEVYRVLYPEPEKSDDDVIFTVPDYKPDFD